MKSLRTDWGKRIAIALAVTLFLSVFLYFSYFIYKESQNIKKYSYEIGVSSSVNALPKELLYAIISVESGFDERATSNKGAKGLMQLLPETAKYIGGSVRSTDLFVPEINISLGAKYFRYLLEKFESLDLAIIAYNAGEGNVSKWIAEGRFSGGIVKPKHIPFAETRKYIEKVHKKIKFYKKLTSII